MALTTAGMEGATDVVDTDGMPAAVDSDGGETIVCKAAGGNAGRTFEVI